MKRQETDSLGKVDISEGKYWGAQTERSLHNFRIGPQASMPMEVITGIVYVKKAAAQANCELGVLSTTKMQLIVTACEEILKGKWNDQFPLVVWQTGSGTQTNMNCNEVIANRGHELNGGMLSDTEKVLHPNDDVNKSQSSNDVFPTAVHLAGAKVLLERTIPSLELLKQELFIKQKKFSDIIKIGRTHLMDATPITLGQEFSAYVSQLDHGIKALNNTLEHLLELPIGGSAVGTGINVPKGFSELVVKKLSRELSIPFTEGKNKFEGLASNDAIVETHGALKQLAVSLYKIANDIRLMGSGPRAGIGELILPENEPGSSIMPGKVNPTQCEALTMVCAQVIGNDAAITFGGSQGQFQLNVFKPLMAYNLLESARLLADAAQSFNVNCVKSIEANRNKIAEHLSNSLMLVTALNPVIGYKNASKIAQEAYKNGTTLKEEALKSGLILETEYDKIMDPAKMV